MIKNVFIPERLGDYYLFSRRILSFDVGRTYVYAAQIYLHGRGVRIEKFLEEKIEQGQPNTYEERAAQAIKKIVARADRYHGVHSAMSGSLVVFKELTLPFIDYEKLSMVVNFEVEPLLPFPLANAVVDFIVTKRNLEEKTSCVFVAAVPNEHIAQHLSLFAQAGIDPEVITVDLFALYGLCMKIPEYAQEITDMALIDFDVHATRIAYISQGQLKFVRTLPKGLSTIAKMVGDELKVQPSEAMEQVVRFGLDEHGNNEYNGVITRILTTFWNDVDFTVRSFVMRTGQEPTVKFLLLGRGSEIKGMCTFVATLVNRPCFLFSLSSLLQDSTIVVKDVAHVPRTHVICLGGALESPITRYFNVRRRGFSPGDDGLFKRQVIATTALLVLILGVLMGTTFWRLRCFNAELRMSSLQAINALKERFKGVSGVLTEATVQNVKAQLERNAQAVSFLDPARPSVLAYLLELTTKIDKKATGISVERIIIEGNVIHLKAKVRGYDELQLLEKCLHDSKMFEFKPVDNIDFDLEIHVIQSAGEA